RGNEVRRIDWMRDETPRFARKLGADARWQYARSRTRQDSILLRRGVELGEHFAFDPEIFGHVFLHMSGTGQCRFKGSDAGDPRAQVRGRLPLEHASQLERPQHTLDRAECARDRFVVSVEKHYVMTTACEGDGPRPAD